MGTVLAPTDDAFDDLPNGLVTCLLRNRNKDVLEDLLLYHVISGEVFSDELRDGQEVRMVNGDFTEVEIKTSGGRSWWQHPTETIFFNDSKVILADVKASNGVVHAIDAVLVPPGFNPAC